MKTLLLILWLHLPVTLFAQSAFRIEVRLERVALTHVEPRTNVVTKVLLVFEGPYIGVFTGPDTLYLKEISSSKRNQPLPIDVYLYKDVLHDNQVYYLLKRSVKSGEFALYFVPVRPFLRNRLYAINLQSL